MDVLPTEDISIEKSAAKPETDRPLKKKKKDKDRDKVQGTAHADIKILRKKSIDDIDLSDAKDKKKQDAKKLKKKLLEAVEENENLSKSINDKNVEIAELRRSIQSLNEVLNSVPIDELRCNSSIASNKLLDLSKKNRTLRAQLEQSKNLVTRREYEILKLQRELKSAEEKFQQDADLLNKGNTAPIEEMQNKISALQQRLFETRNKNTELQTQLKLAQKLLQQEIGEHFNLTALATRSAQSNWRGRAQQILHLQQREKELREKLDVYEQQMGPLNMIVKEEGGEFLPMHNPTHTVSARSERQNISTPKSATSGTAVKSVCSVSSFDRVKPEVCRSQILHRAKIESLEKEIVQLKTDLEQANTKNLALKVRNKNLSEQLMKCRQTHCTQKQLEEYSNVNVTSMADKMEKQKQTYEFQLEDVRSELQKAKRERAEAEYKENTMRAKFEELEELLASKDEYVLELKEYIDKLESDMKALCGGFLFSCRELRKEEFIAILDALESEKTELTKHNGTLNNRLTSERTKNEQLNDQLTKQKIKISRLEAKIRELEKEVETIQERKKRTQRIADYASSVNNLSTGRSVTSFTFENSATISSSTSLSHTSNKKDNEVLELQHELELAKEKIVLLKEKVAYIAEEKENDAKAFESTMLNSKNILLDTILSHKGSLPPTSSISQAASDADCRSFLSEGLAQSAG